MHYTHRSTYKYIQRITDCTPPASDSLVVHIEHPILCIHICSIDQPSGFCPMFFPVLQCSTVHCFQHSFQQPIVSINLPEAGYGIGYGKPTVSIRKCLKCVPLSDSIPLGVPGCHRTCFSRLSMVFQVVVWVLCMCQATQWLPSPW